jgi:hypothetical protein
MATKNKKKRKSTRLVRRTRNKIARPKKTSKSKTPRKSAKRKAAKKGASAKGRASRKSTAQLKTTAQGTVAERDLGVDRMVASSRRGQALSGRQSGDLQGLSDVERADSESIDELLEDGDAFEAGVVQGVEEADDAETSEVRIREVPEDDVPQEYLDKD